MLLRRRIVTCAFVLMAGLPPGAAPRGVAFMANKGSRFTNAQSVFPRQKIVVNDADLARIEAAKVNIREHAERVKLSSLTRDYLNCDGYRELLKLDDKVVPSLIRDLVRLEQAHAIYGKGHYAPTPIDDQEWWLRVQAERKQMLEGALPRFICLETLARTTAGKAARRNGFDGFEESHRCVEWWREHKNRYDLRFKNAETFELKVLENGKRPPGLRCTSSRGLLNVRAVSAPLKNVVDNAAAEAGADVVVLDDSGGLANTTIAVDDREMTFDEFLTALVEDHLFMPWWKEGGTYYVGRGKPAPACWRSCRPTSHSGFSTRSITRRARHPERG